MNRTRAESPRSWIVNPLVGKRAVVQQPVEIERPAAVARHVGVAEHEIHVVDRVQPAEKAPQKPQPLRPLGRDAFRPGNQKHDLLGIERFAVGEPGVRIAADAADQVGELPANDLAAEHLVVQSVVGQKMLVEKMPERPVPHVVQQGGQPHERLDVAPAGHVGADLAQALVERGDRPAGQVHRPQHVLKPRMLGRGKDPPGGLQLVNLPQPLEPRVVDDLPLGDFALRQARRRGEGDVAVDRIVAEAFALEVSHRRNRVGVCDSGNRIMPLSLLVIMHGAREDRTAGCRNRSRQMDEPFPRQHSYFRP